MGGWFEPGACHNKAHGLKAAYMFANGHSKLSATRTGTGRPGPEWRLLFLGTGEIGLADKMAEDPRKRITAGQDCLDLPADAGEGFGVFEELLGPLPRTSEHHHAYI
jgi:hypothetical protein